MLRAVVVTAVMGALRSTLVVVREVILDVRLAVPVVALTRRMPADSVARSLSNAVLGVLRADVATLESPTLMVGFVPRVLRYLAIQLLPPLRALILALLQVLPDL